jgi:hypothetical protein
VVEIKLGQIDVQIDVVTLKLDSLPTSMSELVVNDIAVSMK